jgi:hypothetical protein
MNAVNRALVPTRLALLSIAGFWLFYFLINNVRMAIVDQPDQLGMAWLRGVVTLVGMALTAVLWQLLARLSAWPIGRLLGLVFAASAPIGFAYSLVNHLVPPFQRSKRGSIRQGSCASTVRLSCGGTGWRGCFMAAAKVGRSN